MDVALGNTRIKVMPPAKEEKELVVNQNTAISIGFAVLLLSAGVWNATNFAAISGNLDRLRDDVKDLKSNYVPKNEMTLELKNINSRLEVIEKAAQKGK